MNTWKDGGREKGGGEMQVKRKGRKEGRRGGGKEDALDCPGKFIFRWNPSPFLALRLEVYGKENREATRQTA